MKKRSYFLTAFLLFAGIFNTWAYDGDGSAATPYQIKTVEDLKTLATEVNEGNAYSGKFFELTTDLDLEEAEWTRIGNDKKLFSGTFDGKGHSISNFKISESSTATDGTQNGVGLFGGLGKPNHKRGKRNKQATECRCLGRNNNRRCKNRKLRRDELNADDGRGFRTFWFYYR